MPFLLFKLYRFRQKENPKLFIQEIKTASVFYLKSIRATEIKQKTLRRRTIFHARLRNGIPISLIIDNEDAFLLPVLIKNKKRKYVEHRRILDSFIK